MKSNVHQSAIPEQVIQEAQSKLNAVVELLRPYMITLTPQERHDLPKMGSKSLEFVEKALEFAQANPVLRPAYLDMDAFGVDVKDAHGLWTLLNTSIQITEYLSDTQLCSGSEAYQFSLVFYHAAKAAVPQDIGGAKAVYEDLRKRFPHIRRAAPSESSPDGV